MAIPVKNSRKDRAVCAFKMRVPGGTDNVSMRIWANGKTQVCGMNYVLIACVFCFWFGGWC